MLFRACSTTTDCIRACIASLTDDDNVPHVFGVDIEAEKSWADLRHYLASKGRKLAMFAIADMNEMAENNPGIPYMLICTTGLMRESHAVVGMDGKVIHDPAWNSRQIDKYRDADSGEEFWIVGIVL